MLLITIVIIVIVKITITITNSIANDILSVLFRVVWFRAYGLGFRVLGSYSSRYYRCFDCNWCSFLLLVPLSS